MKREEYYHGKPGAKYGIWNTVKKQFQFGICEDTPALAEARLFQKIGNDARKWRFETRRLENTKRTTQYEPIVYAEWIIEGLKSRCSNCDTRAYTTMPFEDGLFRCPKCGAKMKGIRRDGQER